MPRQYTHRDPILVIGPSIAYLPLTQGFFTLIDSGDAHGVALYSWYSHRHHTGSVYVYGNTKGKDRTGLKLHRFLMGNPENLVDHINGNTLDNRRCNLRVATTSESVINTRIRADNASGLRGLCFESESGKWLVQIWKDGKRIKCRFKERRDAEYFLNDIRAILHSGFIRSDPATPVAPKGTLNA
jgi:hypothetical protein